MAKFDLNLTGYVGAADFKTKDVDRCLAENAGNDVRVLIDSTGGSLASGLSIASAFRNHGAVDVHFRGLNASAATIASLGARSVSMDRGAMYLVHKCSNTVFKWQSMNADQLEEFINELVKNKADLDKIDENIAAMYALRCRKPQSDLLELMKKGGWLTPKEALEWGFIDKITDFAADEPTEITACFAADLRAAGIPLPGPVSSPEKEPGGISSILAAIKGFFRAGDTAPAIEAAAPDDTPQPEQKPVAAERQPVAEQTAAPEKETAPEPKPQPDMRVIDTSSRSNDFAGSFSNFVNTGVSARKLFDSVP